MGSAAVHTTGMEQATLNLDAPQLSTQHCRRNCQRRMSPLETTPSIPAFHRGGPRTRRGLFQPCGRLQRWTQPGPNPGQDGSPLSSPQVCRAGAGASSDPEIPRGHGGTGVRHPKLGSLVGNKRGPPAAGWPARTLAPRQRFPGRAPRRDRARLPGSPASTRRCGSPPRTGASPGGCGAARWSRPCCGAARPLPSDRCR